MTNRSVISSGVQIAIAILGIAIALWLIVQLQSIIVLLLISMVIATAIHPAIEWLCSIQLLSRKYKMPRWLAIVLVLLGMVLLALGIFYFVGATFWKEGGNVKEQLPSYMNGFKDWLAHLRERFPQIPSEQDLDNAFKSETGRFGNYLVTTSSALLGVLGGIGAALTVIVFTFYMLLEREMIRSSFLSLIPPQHKAQVDKATIEALLAMGGWLRGQSILAVAMIALISAAMAILGVPRPFLLGIIGGFGELIPMVGPILAGVIAIPLAFFTMPLWVGIATLVFFILLSTIEGNVIVPIVMQKNVELSPFFTVVAVLIGVTLFGLVGALLSIPIAAALRVYLKRLVIPAIQKMR